MSKTLIFEGAGWEKAESGIKSGVGNCRIRTRIRNDAGRLIYLEILGFEYQGKKPIWAENYSIAGWVDACFYDDSKWDANRNRSKDFRSLTRVKFEYNKENILKLVNENLNCSFDEVQVINDNSVRVFDTEQPLCSSTDKEFPPHKDIEINIDQLESVRPVAKWDRFKQANYKISYNSLMQIPYMKKHIEEQEAQNNKNYIKQNNCTASFMWDVNGIITALELQAGCCMGVYAEDVQQIIDLVLKDNAITAQAV